MTATRQCLEQTGLCVVPALIRPGLSHMSLLREGVSCREEVGCRVGVVCAVGQAAGGVGSVWKKGDIDDSPTLQWRETIKCYFRQ